eukprot:1161902-Pelagomonas_calceolata.AAC.7
MSWHRPRHALFGTARRAVDTSSMSTCAHICARAHTHTHTHTQAARARAEADVELARMEAEAAEARAEAGGRLMLVFPVENSTLEVDKHPCA